ncbi:hypothetical protein FCM35_KLT06711 [Carex littledalei]|uniref:Uncharacterized protein n=1 Tax=Carex littledalei TaxID=544730 RepID=A0A833QK52_9POAL|nr:hypothetical protein FCM35_KLT06711 [Carex littledalei]
MSSSGSESSSNTTTSISSSPVFPPITQLSPSVYLGLGLGFSLFILSRSPPLKPLSSAVKFADSAIKVPKAIKTLNPTSPSSLFSASKALFKGCKATTEILPPAVKRLKPEISFGPLNSKKVKALFSTASLVRYAVSPISSDGFLLLNLLKCGYKVSKNFTKVLEGFVGLQIDSTISTGVDALGYMVKTAGLIKEVTFWLAIGWWGRGSSSNCCPLDTRRPRHGLYLCYQRSRFAKEGFYVNEGFSNGFFGELKENDIMDRDEFELGLGYSISELLSLSVPIHEILPVSSV